MKFLEPIRNTLLYYFPEMGTIKRERLVNKAGNEMWRIGKGLNNFRPFFRIDLGSIGYRWTKEIDYFDDYWSKLYPELNSVNAKKSTDYGDVLQESIHSAPFDLETVEVVRGGGMVVRERKDHWERMWIYANELLREQAEE